VQHIFQRERLEKQLVARVVIGRNRFGIRIHHQRLETVFLERERGVHAAIIELDALADAVRPAAENHHLLLVGIPAHLVITAIISGIIIGRVRLELRGARIHQPVTRNQTEFFAQRADFILRFAGEIGDLAVGKPERFGFC
jgi:hypothetical protein